MMTEKVEGTVEYLLKQEPPNLKRAWQAIKGLYKLASQHAPPTTYAEMEAVTEEIVGLYHVNLSPGYPIPIRVRLDVIPDEPPEADIIYVIEPIS